ncbi:uncharacterized protein RHIMIDRAFT_241686 [Rhizopus microsporus ATCC 52813]|uniref:Thioredoxin domain-containing protein n=1 Tax=Rhizopus microsporus ATCC 52813 TaxID=1340429 RepID=A0A2G4SI10_RHIZD|nr:uncharacterized protein RHIMIDRAFT_241686 [Rhizopus microsporus ATCC 52813]PHZ08413.1 hypothetical protein RHIMIDRAFT_241686 [Rhizopus microsporus ATCC 52813]
MRNMGNLRESASLDQFEGLIVDKNKVVVYFTNPLDQACKLQDPAIDKVAEQFIDTLFVKVDVNEHADIATEFNVDETVGPRNFPSSENKIKWIFG